MLSSAKNHHHENRVLKRKNRAEMFFFLGKNAKNGSCEMTLFSHDIDIMTFFNNTFNHTMNSGWVFFISHDVFLRKQGFYVGMGVWFE